MPEPLSKQRAPYQPSTPPSQGNDSAPPSKVVAAAKRFLAGWDANQVTAHQIADLRAALTALEGERRETIATIRDLRSALEASNKALREMEAKLEYLLRVAGDGVEIGRRRMIVTNAGEFRNLSASTDTLQVQTEDVPIYEWRLRVLGMTLRESLDALAPALVDEGEKS